MFRKKTEPLVAELRKKRELLETKLLAEIRSFEIATGVSVSAITLLKLVAGHPELGFTQKVKVDVSL